MMIRIQMRRESFFRHNFLFRRRTVFDRSALAVCLAVWAAVFLIVRAAPCHGAPQAPPDAVQIRKMALADAVAIALTNNVTLQSAFLDRQLQRIDLQLAERRNYLPSDPTVTLGVNRLSSYTMPGPGVGSTRTEGLNYSGDFSATLAIPTGGSLTFAWNNAGNRPDLGRDYNYSSGWTAVFSQPLLKGGGLTNAAYNVRIARIAEETNLLALTDTIAATIRTAITGFRNYKTAERQLVIAEMGLVRARTLFAYNKDMIEAGRLAGTEIVQAQADIAAQETQVIDAKNNLDSARLSLIQVLNIDKSTFFEAVDEAVQPVAVPPLQEALALAFQYRTDYLRAVKGLETAKLTLARARRNRLWSLDLTAATTDSYAASVFDTYDAAFRRAFNNGAERDWYAGLELKIPLVYMTSDMRSYYGAKNDLEKADLAFEKLKLDIEIEVQNALRNVDSNYRSLKSAQLARQLAEKKLQIEQEKLGAGRTTNFQFVSFQRDLQSAQLSELAAATSYLNALTALDAVLGTTLATWKIDIGREDDRIRRTAGPDNSPTGNP
ncbi:MAG: TolC family protein [Smithellaceae bacterium]|nr:TolC family protein [Smithellaceae bacterium]